MQNDVVYRACLEAWVRIFVANNSSPCLELGLGVIGLAMVVVRDSSKCRWFLFLCPTKQLEGLHLILLFFLSFCELPSRCF